MRKRVLALLIVLLGSVTVAVPVFAHHGTAVFDTDKMLTMKATVTEWVWSNPHCLLQFDVKDDNGQVAHWIAETQNPATMVDGGWGKASFKPGDEVTVNLIPVRNGKPIGRIKTVVLANGKTLDAEAGLRNNTKP